MSSAATSVPGPGEQVAIVITGEAISSLTPERLAEVAASLGTLLGADAAVETRALPEPNQPPKKIVDDLTGHTIPPFSLTFPRATRSEEFDRQVDDVIRAAAQRAPGVIEDVVVTTRALRGLRRNRGFGSGNNEVVQFHYHGDPTYEGYNCTGITLLRPDALTEDPHCLDHIRSLGPKTTKALARLARALTTPNAA